MKGLLLNLHPSPLYLPSSVVELQRELHHARVAGERGDAAGGRAREVPVGQAELRRVEDVEDLPAELEAPVFAEVVERAHERRVEVREVRPAQRVPPAGAEPRRIRHGEGRRIEPAVDGALVTGERAVAQTFFFNDTETT